MGLYFIDRKRISYETYAIADWLIDVSQHRPNKAQSL